VRVLLTGFGPFGSVVDNPSAAIARALDGERVSGREVRALVLPPSFVRARALVSAALEAHEVDLLLHLGVAETSAAFRVERVGRNRDAARIADVDGARPSGAIVEDAPEVLPVSIDLTAVVAALHASGEAAAASDDAGAYVCNHVLFTSLVRARVAARGRSGRLRVGFLHVPPAPESTIASLPHAVPLARQVAAVRAALPVC
jgi:pyroglutamyl-peptidase